MREADFAQPFDVVIIGAGVAGATAAFLSSRAGLRTLLVERQVFPRHKVCGCCLNGRAIRILEQSGLKQGLEKLEPANTSSLAIRYRGQKLDVPMPSNVAVSRSAFDHWLVREASAAGCLFVDDMTATVAPLASELNPDSTNFAAAKKTSDDSEQRCVDLHSSGFLQQESRSHASPLNTLHRNALMTTTRVTAAVVLVCDGLGHPSLARLNDFKAPSIVGSRIGLGAVFPITSGDDWIRTGEILMAVAPHGYAGLVRIENQQWDLAAAIDPSHVNHSKSPLVSLESIFHSAGIPVPAGLPKAAIKGTPALTRTARKIAGHRLFLLGDSAGYVEPFTGEGMAWALTAATAIVPLLQKVTRNGWSNDFVNQWQITFQSIVSREQKVCRLLSAALKRPWLLPPILATCRAFPSLTRYLVSQINRVPEALKVT